MFAKKIIFAYIFVCTGIYTFSQHKRFIYEHIYVSDSTRKENRLSDMMILSIDKNKSEYYSQDRYISDSTIMEDRKKGINSYSKKKMNPDRVIKYSNVKNIDFATPIASEWYLIDDQREMQWVLFPQFNEIQGFKVQKATTEFAGRKWIAWFSPDIPFQDGPYKFRGLPGLIIKIEDNNHNHLFELKGIKNLDANFVYPEESSYKSFINISYSQYVKLYRDYLKDPVAGWVGIFHDQVDSNGKLRTTQEILRELEITEKARLKRENNPIELDLLL